MYSNAIYMNDLTGNTVGLRVEINGITSFVPLDPSNSDYKNIMQLVENGELTIQPAEVTND